MGKRLTIVICLMALLVTVSVGCKSKDDGFTIPVFALLTEVDPAGAGSIARDPDATLHIYGTEVQLTAVANNGCSFSHWSGDLSGAANPETIEVKGHKSVTANFLQILTTSLPDAVIDLDYSETLQAAGGAPPYTWQKTSGNLPDGLSLDSGTGEIAGIPTALGTFDFTIELTDNNAITADLDLSIIVKEVDADFSADPLSGPCPLEVQFTDLSRGIATAWEWDFDDDGFIDSTVQNPSYTYQTGAAYTVSLTVNSSDTETKADYIVVLGGGPGTNVDWVQVYPAPPPPVRRNHEMTFDSNRNLVVLFGGQCPPPIGRNDDTWEYDGRDWTQVFPAIYPPSSAGRYYHALAFDSNRNVVVLFGGGPGCYDDTWEYDGTTWTEPVTAHKPPGRTGHAMAFDAINNVVVLFGGSDGSNNDLGDTWLYDGTDWTEVTPPGSPRARRRHEMVFDCDRGVIVMFGGSAWGTGNVHGTTEYNAATNTWTGVSTANSPCLRSEFALVYDSYRRLTVLFGGTSGSDETWEYNGTDWKQRITDHIPIGRKRSAMAFDSRRQVSVLFGGGTDSGDSNDTWELTPIP